MDRPLSKIVPNKTQKRPDRENGRVFFFVVTLFFADFRRCRRPVRSYAPARHAGMLGNMPWVRSANDRYQQCIWRFGCTPKAPVDIGQHVDDIARLENCRVLYVALQPVNLPRATDRNEHFFG